MDRGLCWGAIGVAALLLLMFLLDMFVGSWPLYGASTWLDIFGILAAAVIIYVSVDTLRELK